MRILSTVGFLALAFTSAASIHRRDYDTHDYFAVQLSPSSSPSQVAESLGATYEGPLGELPEHHTFSSPRHRSHEVDEILQELRRRRRKRDYVEVGDFQNSPKRRSVEGLDGVMWSQKQKLKPRLHKRIPPPQLERRQGPPPGNGNIEPSPEQKTALKTLDQLATTLDIRDPIFKEQWHLYNPMQLGHDINVTGLWLQGITGNGSISVIVDDGLDMYSDDLKDNYYAQGSFDFNDKGPEPKPRLFDDKHGTRCAGEVAAVRNDVCGVGVAYDSKVAGIRILSKQISDEDEAVAVNYAYQHNDIYSCSWGPPDDGRTMDAPGILIKIAMVNGVQHGRGGKGSVFVFAAGNGAASEDNCNFDGYTNSIYSITVGAIDREGNHPYYSEACSAQLVVTYSSGGTDAIHTTDVGIDKCYNGHGGTSAAGPLMVGVIALALSARPDLSWRDLQYLSVQTAVPIHDEDSDWQTTKIGKKFSHTFGYGKVDAYAYVEAAKEWTNVKPQAWYHSPWLKLNHEIPQGVQGLASTFEVTSDILKEANLERLEHVTVTMNVNHTRRGDLSVELRSPEGVVSHLSTTRRLDSYAGGYVDWTFMSVAHWGESGIGTWTVIVKDTNVNEFNGTFIDWRLNLWGECIDGSIQNLHPYPSEHEDDHDIATAPAVIETTSIAAGSTPTALPSTPTDHIDRPVNEKPSQTDTTPPSTATAIPTPTSTESSTFLPSFFPTFGVSARTQIWIYGALALIIIFCSALSIYFIVQRRKRLRNNPRDDYEFEMLDEDDDQNQGLNGHAAANGKKMKPPKRRAGELYDAFAGESDDEDLVFSDDDEEEGGEGPYRDQPEERGRSEKRVGSSESLDRARSDRRAVR